MDLPSADVLRASYHPLQRAFNAATVRACRMRDLRLHTLTLTFGATFVRCC